MSTPQTKYFSIHSVAALNNKQFSEVIANIDNTPSKVEMAKELYPNIEDWWFEFHDYKKDMKWVF